MKVRKSKPVCIVGWNGGFLKPLKCSYHTLQHPSLKVKGNKITTPKRSTHQVHCDIAHNSQNTISVCASFHGGMDK